MYTEASNSFSPRALHFW